MFCGPVCFVWDKILALIMSIPFILAGVIVLNTRFEDWNEKRRLKKEGKCK